MRIINLSESHNAKVFDTSNLIHDREFEQVEEWINLKIKNAPAPEAYSSDKENNFTNERLHDTISVLGSRGSGKTTFLYSLLSNYDSNKNTEVLDIIDPTLIEDKGHVFLTIISLIKTKVEDKLSRSETTPGCSIFQQKNLWDSTLKKVSAGIPSMDGVGPGYEGWNDPEIIMHKGLSQVKAAKTLESDFQSLVQHALRILNKKVFIITFDDIDINFKRGWPVLETIRKYLTSPHIITLLSGDLRLFSKAIRKRQWDNFGKGLLINEGDKLGGTAGFNDLVTEMEGQYLLKVLRTQRRVILTTLLEKRKTSNNNRLNIYVGSKNIQTRRLPISTYYMHILRRFGINNPYQAETYISFLLGLPIRTQIQFLSVFDDGLNKNLSELDIISPFISDLYEKKVDIDIIKANNVYMAAGTLKFLITEKILDNSYQLQPTTMDISLNSSLLSLSFLFSTNISSDPYLIFDYMMRVGYVRNATKDMNYTTDRESLINDVSVEGLCLHASIYDDKVLKNTVGLITAYLQGVSMLKRQKSPTGLIELPGLAQKSRGKRDESEWRFDRVMQDVTTLEHAVAFLPLSISEDKRGYNNLVYSIHTLLATIGELVRRSQHKNFINDILELAQVRTYPMPTFEGSSTKSTSKNDILDEDIPIDDEKTLYLLKFPFEKWVKDFGTNTNVSPHVLGKISTRIYNSLERIDRASITDNNLGDEIHRRIISLMNAILIEDIKENTIESDRLIMNFTNPDTSSKVFIDNLSKLKGSKRGVKERLSFSKWMLGCPLLLIYLNPKDQTGNKPLIDELLYFIGLEKHKIMELSIYNILTKVKLDTPKNPDDKLSSFYYSKKNYQQTIDHLKENKDIVSYNDFMTSDLPSLKEDLKQLFAKNINDIGIIKVREYIKDNDIKEW